MRASQPSDLTTVYVGPRECVSILEARLAAEGIPSYVPLEGAVDFYGAIVYGFRGNCAIQVPLSLAERAQAIAAREFPPAPAAKRKAVPSWVYAALALVGLVALLIAGL